MISLAINQEAMTMLVQWTPFREMARLHADFDRLFNEGEKVRGWTPAVDVAEDDQKIELFADLPGVAQSELEISVDKDVLTLRGERKLARKGERVNGPFSRSFSLPKTVDVEKIQARLQDGVLTLTLPKRPEAQPRQIKIAVS
jgi:HSP20 family protein